jgi:hypothetical protein
VVSSDNESSARGSRFGKKRLLHALSFVGREWVRSQKGCGDLSEKGHALLGPFGFVKPDMPDMPDWRPCRRKKPRRWHARAWLRRASEFPIAGSKTPFTPSGVCHGCGSFLFSAIAVSRSCRNLAIVAVPRDVRPDAGVQAQFVAHTAFVDQSARLQTSPERYHRCRTPGLVVILPSAAELAVYRGVAAHIQ